MKSGWGMFKRSRGIGLHIGSQTIRIAILKNKKSRLHLINYGSMLTPAGLLDAGNIVDPEQLGADMRQLVQELNIKGQPVFSAVSGPQVYTRNLIMPRMKPRDLKEASIFQASTFLPIPVEQAAIDVFPLRHFEDEEGPKTEVFFVAVRKIQVEMLDAACHTAGLNLVAVEIGPLAICRVLCDWREPVVAAYLYMGVTRTYFTVFNGGMLVFFRYLSLASSSAYQQLGIDTSGPYPQSSPIPFGQSIAYPVKDIAAELTRSIEYFELQHRETKVSNIVVCGPGSGAKGLTEGLSESTGLEIRLADEVCNIVLPESLSLHEKRELQFDYLVAMGLAAREMDSGYGPLRTHC